MILGDLIRKPTMEEDGPWFRGYLEILTGLYNPKAPRTKKRAFGAKDQNIQGFWAILSLRVSQLRIQVRLPASEGPNTYDLQLAPGLVQGKPSQLQILNHGLFWHMAVSINWGSIS